MANRHKKRRVLKRDQRLCGIHLGGCGRRIEEGAEYNRDHIVPRALFSKVAKGRNAEFNEDWNCQPMHVDCNNAKDSKLRSWPRFDCDCHYLQVHGNDLYVHTKDPVGEGRHKLIENVVSERNDKVDAKLVIGSGKVRGGKTFNGYQEGKFGYLLPGIAKSHVEVFNLTERGAVGLSVPKYIELDDQGRVVDRWGNAVPIGPRSRSAETFYNRGLSLAGLGRLEEALEDFDEAIRTRPVFPEAYRSRGASRARLGRLEDALADFDTAIRQKPDFAEAYYNRGVCKNSQGRHREAVVDYDEAIRIRPVYPEAYRNRGTSKAQLGRTEDAMADFDMEISQSPDTSEAYFNRGIVKKRSGLMVEAIEDFDDAIRMRPVYPEAFLERGVSKSKLGRVEDAIADFDATICQRPEFSEAHFNRGVAKNSLGKYVEAMADYSEVIRLEPENGAAYCNRGVIKNNLGKYEEALVDLDRAVALCPADVKALNNRAGTYLKLGRALEAIEDFQRAISLSPGVAEIHYNLGIVQAGLPDMQEARRSLDTALELAQREDNASLITMIGQALARIGAP